MLHEHFVFNVVVVVVVVLHPEYGLMQLSNLLCPDQAFSSPLNNSNTYPFEFVYCISLSVSLCDFNPTRIPSMLNSLYLDVQERCLPIDSFF